MQNRIRMMREARALSLDELAACIGTTNQQISLLESGKRRLTVDWLLKLGKALKCHPWSLVGEELPESIGPIEMRFLEAFRQLGAEHRKALMLLATSIRGLPVRRRARTSRA